MDNNKEPLPQYTIWGLKPAPAQFTFTQHDSISLLVPITQSEIKDGLDLLTERPLPSVGASQLQRSTYDSLLPLLTDPNHESNRHRFRRSNTAPEMVVISNLSHKEPVARMISLYKSSVLGKTCALFIFYMCFAFFFYWLNPDGFIGHKTHPVVDALYFCIVTMFTIGYGDITPNSAWSKSLSVLLVLMGFHVLSVYVSGLFSYMIESKNEVKESVKTRRLAFGFVVLCIATGAGIMHFVENIGWFDSCYFSVMSVMTVGYGDLAFKTFLGRIFASIWFLVAIFAVLRTLMSIAVARMEVRNRQMAKWALGYDMTVSDFVAADIDNNGYVSKSDYLVHMLKMMKKVSDKDIRLICSKFDKLDSDNMGRITLADVARAL